MRSDASSDRLMSQYVFVDRDPSCATGRLPQIAKVCCSGWWAARASASTPGRWAAASHRGCSEAGVGGPLEAAE